MLRGHIAGGEDLWLTAVVDFEERVYMLTDLKNLWSEGEAMWQVHVRQHHQLIEARVAVVQEYKRLRSVRTWLG